MHFQYVKFEGDRGPSYRPCVPVTFGYENRRFPVGNALVDTGSDITLLPLEVAHLLEVELDDAEAIRIGSAGGGVFRALPSRRKLTYTVQHKGFRPLSWDGTVFFAENEQVALLGHYQCLEMFELTFHGPERKLDLVPRFRV